jgi:hypothetical protein
MYSPQLREITRRLDPSKDCLVVRDFEGEKGMGMIVEAVGDDSKVLEVPQHVRDAVAKVISEYGFLRTETLIKEAKATTPFLFAKKGEYLNWDLLLEERCEGDENLSEKGLVRLSSASRFKESRTFCDIEGLNEYLFS